MMPTITATAQRPRVRRGALSLVLGTSALLMLAGSASAAVFTPANGADLVAAVSSANATPNVPDTILLNTAQSSSLVYQPPLPMVITDDLTIKKSGKAGTGNIRAQINGQAVAPIENDLFTIAAGVNVRFETVIVQAAATTGFNVFNNSGNLTIARSSMSGNNGQIFLNQAGATLTVDSSTANDNNDGQALDNQGGTVTFNQSSVLNNIGGLTSAGGTLTLNNTVVAGNNPDCAQPVDASTTSWAGDSTCGIPNGNPMLGLVTTGNGGPTATAAPQPGSPLINAGTNSLCPTTADQRYFARTDSQCDIGAYEVGAVVDNTAPSCAVSATVTAPPKQQQVTAQDGGTGVDAGDPAPAVFPPFQPGPATPPNPALTGGISDIRITNGDVTFTPFTSPSRSSLVLTATKSDQNLSTRWSFIAKDLAGNQKDCR
jgi:hypothetical protein